MSSLLDTCVIPWAAREPRRLSIRIHNLLLNPAEEVVISIVSAWEISLKPELNVPDAAGWIRQAASKLQAQVLPVRLEHIAVLQRLPQQRRDAFDRLLIAQAIADGPHW